MAGTSYGKSESSSPRGLATAVTIHDIARECGVGVGTASRALNNSSGVSEKTRQKVLSAAQRLNYSPNPHAQSLRSVASASIAVLMKGPDNPFFLAFLTPLESVIRQHGYSMTLVRVAHGEDEVQLAMRTCSVSKPAGIIFLGGRYRHEEAPLADIPVPFVLCTISTLDDSQRDMYSSVTVDDVAGMELLLDHLVDLGHEHFAVIGSDAADCSVGAIRLGRLERAFQTRGIEWDPDLILNGEASLSPYSFEYGYEIATRLLQQRKHFTALITMSDVLAIGAQRALIEHGISVPADVSVTGYDGLAFSRYTSPSITTIVQSVETLVERSCTILFGILEGKGTVQHDVIAPVLRIGESTGSAPWR